MLHSDTTMARGVCLWWAAAALTLTTGASRTCRGEGALERRENFQVAGKPAFVMMPPQEQLAEGATPWVWYAPTLGAGLPGKHEAWMFDRLHHSGIAIAGIDVGESYGNAAGCKTFQQLYEELTRKRGFSKRPVLLARSRGGLMLYNWAVDHPHSVGGIAGIYPVCNLASYPGLQRAAPAYQLTPEALRDQLTQHNPLDRLAQLAKAEAPLFHIHGDQDKVVPLEANSGKLAQRYRTLGGPVEVEVIKGQGHNLWKGWFESERLLMFMIKHAKPTHTAKSR